MSLAEDREHLAGRPSPRPSPSAARRRTSPARRRCRRPERRERDLAPVGVLADRARVARRGPRSSVSDGVALAEDGLAGGEAARHGHRRDRRELGRRRASSKAGTRASSCRDVRRRVRASGQGYHTAAAARLRGGRPQRDRVRRRRARARAGAGASSARRRRPSAASSASGSATASAISATPAATSSTRSASLRGVARRPAVVLAGAAPALASATSVTRDGRERRAVVHAADRGAGLLDLAARRCAAARGSTASRSA